MRHIFRLNVKRPRSDTSGSIGRGLPSNVFVSTPVGGLRGGVLPHDIAPVDVGRWVASVSPWGCASFESDFLRCSGRLMAAARVVAVEEFNRFGSFEVIDAAIRCVSHRVSLAVDVDIPSGVKELPSFWAFWAAVGCFDALGFGFETKEEAMARLLREQNEHVT